MKISNSKKQLARIISDNGGWPEGAEWAVQGRETMLVGFSKTVPYRRGGGWFIKGETPVATFKAEHVIANWHQTVLARDEYFHLYPAQDAAAEEPEHVWTNPPTIEQLAAEYRNRKDYAARKQQEANEAKAEAEAKLAELVAAGNAAGLAVSVAASEHEPELVITDWRDLHVDDVVEITSVHAKNNAEYYHHVIGEFARVVMVGDVRNQGLTVRLIDGNKEYYIDGFKFIRRPANEVNNA